MVTLIVYPYNAVSDILNLIPLPRGKKGIFAIMMKCVRVCVRVSVCMCTSDEQACQLSPTQKGHDSILGL